jgi:hypothetical protein
MNEATLLGFLVLASTAALGCGDAQTGDDVETAQGALSAFGSWSAIPNGTFNPGNPALASGGLDTHAFAIGNDSNVYSNFKTSATTWNSGWSKLPNNGVVFAGPPAAAGLDRINGNTVGFDALAEFNASGTFFVGVMVDNGSSIVQNWTALPNATFLGQPAIAATLSNAPFGPKSTLFLAGRGTDNRIWVAKNVMTNGVYLQSNWTGFQPIPNGTFQTAPALSYACPKNASDPVVLATAIGFDNRIYLNKSTNGTTWSGWSALPNGTFQTKTPAIATSCGGNSRESVAFALGMDSRIYFTSDHGTGTFDPGFTVIGTQTFADGPGATAVDPSASTVGFTVAARVTDGRIFSARASVP